MSTAEEGGATANAATYSNRDGGAGGKFRKRPFRLQTTPYDRPPAALCVNNTNSNNNSSWLTKMVFEPASKLIAYGADRVFRRRLPLPPPHPPEVHDQESAGYQEEDINNKGSEQESIICQSSQRINSSTGNYVAELEHLLKQKTFTRYEIAHLTELLQSQAAYVSPGDTSRKNVVSALDSGRKKELESCVAEGNRNGGIGSSVVTFTPVHNSNVLETDIASPAELAKAYMGSRPSQVSPSVLGMRNQLGKEGIGLLSNKLITSKSPARSLAKKTSLGLGAAENGFITPRSWGRSVMYNMARTPYSGARPSSILKGSGINSSGYAGPSASLSSLSLMENDESFDSRPMTLKRRSSALDDEVGSVSPMRRIRQKPNLLAPRFHYAASGMGIGSHAKQKPQLNDKERNKVLKSSGENDNESVRVASYSHVPSKSTEVAAKILQQLEKLSPKEKSPQSKIKGKYLNVHDSSHKSGDWTKGKFLDVHDSSPSKQGEAEKNNPNNSAVFLKSSTSVVINGASQPQAQKAFRMSREEDSLEQNDVEFNGLASRSLSGNNTKPDEESQTIIQTEDKSLGQESNCTAAPASEGDKATSQSQVFASSVSVFDRPKEANSTYMFSFSSKAADKFPLLPSESIRRAESEPECSSSLANISPLIGSEIRTPESEAGFHSKPVKAVDTNGKCDDASFSAPLFTTSTNITNFSPAGASKSASAQSIGSFSGFGVKPSSSVEPVLKSGFSADLSCAISEAPKVGFSDNINPISGSSSSSTIAECAAAGFGNSSYPTGNCLQGSFFASATKSPASEVGTISQASFPALNTNTSSSLGSLPTPGFSFGFGSTSSSDASGGPTTSSFKFDATPTAGSEGSAVTPIFTFSSASVASSSLTNAIGSSSTPVFTFGGASVPSSSTNPIGSSSGPPTPKFNFGGGASVSAPAINTASSFSSGTSGIFASQSAGFSFSAAPPIASNSFIGASPAPIFSNTSAPSPLPMFSVGGGFAASSGNSDQMNAKDSMAEDPMPSSAIIPAFDQPSVSPSPTTLAFAPSQTNQPFVFGGQQSQVPPQNPSPLQAWGSLEFNAGGGGFSLGSAGGDTSRRKRVNISKTKNRKK